MKAGIATASCLVILGVALANAQERRTAEVRKASIDDKFVKGVQSGGQFEIKISQLAIQRTRNPEVKQFAQMMVEDHTRANADFAKIAPKGAQTSEMNPIHTVMFNELSQKQGEDFDECFIGMQVLAHTEAVMCFAKEAKHGQNPELKAFAEKTLPGLKKHLQAARRLCDVEEILAER